MVELEAGSIAIDGRNIATLGLTALRRGLSMIPQDPFMFSGTVRRNLDPFSRYDDAAVWHALEQVRHGARAAHPCRVPVQTFPVPPRI